MPTGGSAARSRGGAGTPTAECRVAAAAWAAAHRTGFRMGVNNALKRVTFAFPALRTLLLSYIISSKHDPDGPGRAALRRAVERPLLVDVGAAGYGPPEYSDGSDALLLLKRCGVRCEVHGFEMQPGPADALEKEAAALLASPGSDVARAGSSFSVHRLGVGATPALLHAKPLPGGKPKMRTVTLTPVGARLRVAKETAPSKQKRAQLSRTVNVTSLDVWAAPFDRPLMYLKVDTNGHEPAILRGMARLLNSAPPLFLSFEYSDGWSEELAQRNKSTRLTLSALRVSLRAFVGTLHAAGYHAYLLHSDGLLPMHGGWWDDGYELLLSDDSRGVYDFFAARAGPPARALETLFFHAPLPCLPATALSSRPGLSGYDLCTAATSSVAKQLELACV